MKKLFTIAALLGAASLTYGQGYVSFANSSTTRITTNSVVDGASTGRAAGAGNYYYALFVGATTATITPGLHGVVDPTSQGWTFTGNVATNSAVATGGLFTGNYSPSGGVAVNVGAVHGQGDAANWLVVGWSADNGSTWAAVAAKLQGAGLNAGSFFGISGVGANINAGGDPAVGAQYTVSPQALFAVSPGFISGFNLGLQPGVVPEPSTFALIGLGFGSLMMIRRRK